MAATIAGKAGVINGDTFEIGGERLYLRRGRAPYGKTSIDLSKGERWFCEWQEARTAGSRRAVN